MVEQYGIQDNQYGKTPMAQVLFGHDVLNDICLFSDIAGMNSSENSMLMPWLDQFSPDMFAIYDRLFPSVALFWLHLKKNVPFVARCKLKFNKVVKEFVASGLTDSIVQMEGNKKAIKTLEELGYSVEKGTQVQLRLIRVELVNQTEVLITSLLDSEKYPTEVFKDLYAKRWGVETGIGNLKNHLQLILFEGHLQNLCLELLYHHMNQSLSIFH